MRIGRVVVACVYGPLVGFGHGGVLAGELGVEVTLGVILRTVVHVEADAQRKHVLALDHRLVVKAHVGQSGACHGCDVGDDDVVVLESELGDGVKRCVARLLDMLLGERVAVDYDRCVLLEPLAVSLERCGVHGHQHVAEVARVGHLARAEVYLKSRNTGHGALRGAYLGRIVRKCRNAVADQSRRVGEERSCELHSVARIAREAYDDIFQLFGVKIIHVREDYES